MTCIYPDGAALLAPIAGLSDLPMRMACRKFGCKYAFTEMIDAGSLIYQSGKTPMLAIRGADEDFLGIQLVGSDLPQLAQAVEIVNGMNFDVLDFNLGCPAPKVTADTMIALFKPSFSMPRNKNPRKIISST